MFYKYWTLKEFVDHESGSDNLPYNASLLGTLISGVGITGYPLDLTKDSIKQLWQNFYARFFDYYMMKKGTCVQSELSTLMWDTNDTLSWFTRFLNVLNNTYPYYNALLTNYANEEAKLMDNVKASSSSKTGFNDTPQQPNESGTYESTDYLTNFSKTSGESESELSPKIIRLKEIQDNYKRVMNDWLLEFDCLVMFVERG